MTVTPSQNADETALTSPRELERQPHHRLLAVSHLTGVQSLLGETSKINSVSAAGTTRSTLPAQYAGALTPPLRIGSTACATYSDHGGRAGPRAVSASSRSPERESILSYTDGDLLPPDSRPDDHEPDKNRM